MSDMAFPRFRAAALGAAAITLTLTACAPPGQGGAPGVAATYEGHTVTNTVIAAIDAAWTFDTKGKDVANRRQILTIELLRDDLLAKCKELGTPVSLTTAKSYADQWITFKGETGEASDEVIAATQGILALTVVVYSDPTLDSLRTISDNAAKTAQVSPRSGEYSTDALLASVNTAMQSVQNQQLGQFAYTEFQNVTAFKDEDRAWFDRG